MRIDLAAFDANKNFVLNWFNTTGAKDPKRTISMMASALGVPCIVIAYWLGVETEWDPRVIESIKRLIDFYGYTDIENKPEGAPI